MPTKITSLNAQQKARIPEWNERWMKIILATGPTNRDIATKAVIGMYAAANMPAPRVIFVPSPLVAAIAGSIAAGIWWLRTPDGQAFAAKHLAGAKMPTYAATDAATRAATDAATDAATRAATDAATDAATRAATDAATDAATRAATDAATDAATHAATRAATNAATNAATHAATYAATDAATYAATNAATCAATDAATRAATYAATNAATDAATRAATNAATYAATNAATYAATDAATYAATDAATYAATNAATCAATHAATYAATRAATELEPTARFLVGCCVNAMNNMNGGNHWASWTGFLSFWRDVVGLQLPEHANYAHYEALAIHSGWRYVHNKFCMVSDRPEVLKSIIRNGAHVAHCEDGPSHRWSDGWSLWHINGVRVDEQIILHPETQTIEQIRRESNEEVRRIRIERFGWDRYLTSVNAKVVDAEDDVDGIHQALMKTNGETVLCCACPSTGRTYSIEVSPGCATVAHAQNYLRADEEALRGLLPDRVIRKIGPIPVAQS